MKPNRKIDLSQWYLHWFRLKQVQRSFLKDQINFSTILSAITTLMILKWFYLGEYWLVLLLASC